ncbi:MAG: hypothetical protein RI907_3675 [Pseudomonadota bacterium]|jgi:phosphate acetyltransferase/phosphate butyryltransferase
MDLLAPPPPDLPARTDGMIENRTFDELQLGDAAQLSRTLQADDILLFAAMSGDVNPAHVDPDYARSSASHGIIAHGMWGASLISAVIGTEFPGPGTVYLSQSLSFLKPLRIGDTLDVRLTVTQRAPGTREVTLACCCTDQHGDVVIRGTAQVLAPSEKVRRPRIQAVRVSLHDETMRFRQLLALTAGAEPVSTAVVHPCGELDLRGVVEAAARGLIRPILIGPERRLRALAEVSHIDLAGVRVVDVPHSHAAAGLGVAMARQGEVAALMQGSLRASELMAAVLSRDAGLRTERRISHVLVADVPSYPKPLLISDAMINIAPELEDKRDIVQNAIDLAHAIGLATPKVAILAAVEEVHAKMKSTLDAAALCKMADRGQITGGVVDGPLAFDSAISPQAVLDKGIESPVAGVADILIAPDLEAANMLALQLQYLADAQVAGVLMGARVPIVVPDRSSTIQARVASCALALLVALHRQPKRRM